jgi:plastocyanin
MSDLFFVFGIGLCALALLVAFVGVRKRDFPASTPVLAGGLAIFAALVAATCAFAVVLAREEQEHREHERAAHEAEVSEEEPVGEGAGGEQEGAADEGESASGESASGGAGAKVELSSPEDGSLVFEPDTVEATAGEVTIEYTNPSQVPHDVAIEADGETIAQGDQVTGGETSVASAELEPGEYVFYCTVPGHREGGMEGTLTVK